MTAPIVNEAAQKLAALRSGIATELAQHPRYRSLIEDLRARRPKVPYWNPKEDNTAELQAASAAQKWHDVIMAIIDPASYPGNKEV